MAYLTCERCGLEIRIQAEFLRIKNCPRCLARSATIMPMLLSSSGVVRASGWGRRRRVHVTDAEHGA